MNPLVLALVLSSAVVHATWNLWIKQIAPGTRSGSLMWTLTAISAVVYAPLAVGVLAATGWRPAPIDFAWIGGSAVIHVLYFLLLMRGYRVGDLSLVYPVARGTGPMLATLGAIVWFGERPTPLSISGVLLIACGVLVLTWRSDPLAHARRLPALGYGLATGVLIAGYTLWDGWSVQRVAIPPLVFYWAGEVVRVILFTPAALADRAGVTALWRGPRWRVVGIAVLSPLSYILILLALRHGLVSHIAPARELSILIGVYLGGRVLREGERTRRLVAATAFASGVIALALT